MYYARAIRKLIKKQDVDKDLILCYISDIIHEATIAKKDGQSMENRLKKYRRTIESLDFTKVKK
jgi:hypothetical protein